MAGIERYDNWPMTKLRRSLEHIIFYLFSCGIMRKEEKEMWFGILLFVVWVLFSWAYLSEMDEYLNGDDED